MQNVASDNKWISWKMLKVQIRYCIARLTPSSKNEREILNLVSKKDATIKYHALLDKGTNLQ